MPWKQIYESTPGPCGHLLEHWGRLKKQAEYPEALDMYRKALVIDQKVHGPEHPDVATTLMNMGKVYDE